jgi:3',5'-cyclic AMP phosphodiesterase CpdA
MFTLAHLSDPHLGPLPKPRLKELASKRVFGFMNWQQGRHVTHRPATCDALVDDMRREGADHVAVTGDLVNIALVSEFAPARRWLETLGKPADVTVVPGNHDSYTRDTRHHHLHHWGPYMRGDDDGAAPDRPHLFPFVRKRGDVAIVGLSTAIPTAPFMATGRLGADQLMRLADILERLGHEGYFRVIAIHHPPVGGQGGARFKRLIDAGPMRNVIKARGAELVIHGHNHALQVNAIEGPQGAVPVLGVPSATATPGRARNPAAYNLYRITRGDQGFVCQVTSRGYADAHTGIRTLAEMTYGPSAVAHRPTRRERLRQRLGVA